MILIKLLTEIILPYFDRDAQIHVNDLLEKQRRIAPPGTILNQRTDPMLLSNPIARAEVIQEEKLQTSRFLTWTKSD